MNNFTPIIDALTIPLFNKWRIRNGVEINGERWQKRLDHVFDAVVYSTNAELAAKCRRLLTAKIWGEPPETCEVRRAANVHTKLYLFHSGSVWIGSRNLVKDNSYHNIMIEVHDEEQRKSLRLYFERLWQLAKGGVIAEEEGL